MRRCSTKVERFLAAAQAIRDHIIKANMRLVISVVKKFVTPQHSFDDMLSDGIYSLMQAVDKFDFDRGFRFSTYACEPKVQRARLPNRGVDRYRSPRLHMIVTIRLPRNSGRAAT